MKKLTFLLLSAFIAVAAFAQESGVEGDVDKAAVPANPEITLLDYYPNWYITFNIPLVDVDGEPLDASKLSYMIYVDINGEVSPLTFTPETHTELTEAMTEIPYGFTDENDFTYTGIRLKDLFSGDWNKIGIQSIYAGGGELNATEIQWYEIKPYSKIKATFNFNTLEVATSSNANHDGDIIETLELTAENVTLAISPKDENATTANRLWGTSAGPQLRVYSGTLTFSIPRDYGPKGYAITQIAFNSARWNEGNTADSGEFYGATWTGSAQTVVISIAGNTQINSIVVTVNSIEPELVVLPKGLETEDWTFEGFFDDGGFYQREIQSATEVAFDGNDVYVKGILFNSKDAWIKGTLDTKTGIVTFPSGQFVGEVISYYSHGQKFVVGSEDGETYCDILFAYDAEAKTLTQVTKYIYELYEDLTPLGEIGPLGYWSDMFISADEPIVINPVVVPKTLATEKYLFKANDEEYEEYVCWTEVGFDGNDVYFNFNEVLYYDLWAKGTLSEDGKTVTIPANQYMGEHSYSDYSSHKYYLTSVDEDGNMVDLVLNYDAETRNFSTDQIMILNSSKRLLRPYVTNTFTDVVFINKENIPATPNDPYIVEFAPNATSPYVDLSIPVRDAGWGEIVSSKLFYTIWVKKNGEEQPLTLAADLYSNLSEDMTEIPYNFTDNSDIYTGGTRVYLKQDAEEIASWTTIGVQSIYYGGGERNVSDIVWLETGTGIASLQEAENTAVINAQGPTIVNLAGQRVQKAQKGLYIVNGKKVVVK